MTLRCRSFAKINWTLEALGKREDGYHEIRTLLQTVDIHDELVFEPAPHEISLSCSALEVAADAQNLVHRAAVLLRDYRKVTAGVAIHLEKRIPAGAGLGGGSSNAAVTLMALDRLWKTALGPAEFLALARQLGSDVPFFLLGGTAVALGRGDEVYPLPDRPAPYLLIVTPSVRVKTTNAYGRLLTNPKAISKMPVSCAAVFCNRGAPLVASNDEVPSDISQNDFEPFILKDYPEILRAFERMAS